MQRTRRVLCETEKDHFQRVREFELESCKKYQDALRSSALTGGENEDFSDAIKRQ